MRVEEDQLVIVQKYETFLAYMYPIVQNLPRKHGVAKEMLLRDMLGQVQLFIIAGRSNQISRLREADAGLAHLRFWLRFLSGPSVRAITDHQHTAASVILAQVGGMVGAWIKKKADSGKA